MIRTVLTPQTPFFARFLTIAALVSPTALFALDAEREDVQTFVDELVASHGFDRGYVTAMLSDGQSVQKILDAISRPAERTKAWHEYRAIFMTPERIHAGVRFLSEHHARLNKIAAETGVPEEIITAIIGVETFYGQIRGNFRVLDALSTLAFDYPPRGKFFRSELEQLFLLAREEPLDLSTMTGSYAGAMGPPQFIPSSYRRYAVDGDGDGARNLLDNWDDILASVANYFVANGWKPNQPVAVEGKIDGAIDLPAGKNPGSKNKLRLDETVASIAQRGLVFETELDTSAPARLITLEGPDGPEYWVGFHNFYVITRYNRSAMYALAVYQLAESLAREASVSGNDAPDLTRRNTS